ncbi:class I SAM-dependent methyltransferase [Actinokineospora sp. HUAS TT18]|uniref:class I SAM-dependent methyltransferase n=1 Tax=Actinokineospora sp. HUAS TT18 TaxID=3447451 RepID=UPI003F528113
MNLLTDNPALYEAQFPDPDHKAARFVEDLVTRFHTKGTLLDIGSGTGRDAGYLAAQGFQVHGIDSSTAMVDHARAHHPNARFTVGDMRDFRLDQTFDVITCLDSAFLYCHTNADLHAFLDRCREHANPGALLIAEMRNGAYFLGNDIPDSVRSVIWEGIPYTSHTTLWVDHAAQLLRRRREWRWPGAESLVQHSAWRLLFPQELAMFLNLAGFDVVAMFDTPGPRTDPPWRPDAELGGSLSGDRLHLVARKQ